MSARFQILSQLGRGGMGIVYEAFDHERGERVALKTLSAVEPLRLVQLKNEFRRLRQLHHPNLARVHELVSDGDRWYLSMEVVDGVDILGYVSDAPRVPRPETGTSTAWRITPVGPPSGSSAPPESAPPSFDATRLRHALHGLAAALAELHRAGLVHLDVKPSNVLVTPSGRVVLFDFGLTTDAGADPALQPHTLAGSPAYMAPERLAGAAAAPAADWYGVGAVAYEAMTGVCPRREGPPDRPSARAPGVPADLDELCARLLEREPERRAQAGDVQALLGADRERSPRRAPVPTFVGRAAELEEIARARAEAQRGGVVSVLVTGDSGVGKTALVSEALVRAGGTVLAGRCYERESVPFRGLDAVVDALARHLAWLPASEVEALLPPGCEPLVRLFPSLRRAAPLARLAVPDTAAPPAELRLAALRALRDLLTRLGRREVVLIQLDDLQWADGDTRVALPLLLAPDPDTRLLFLATAREAIAWLPGEVRRLALGPLPEAEATALAGCFGSAIDARAIAEAAAGHPLFVAEMARRAERTGVSPTTLDEVLRARVAELSEAPRELCELVAVAGVPVSVRALGAVFAAPSLWNALDALLDARLLRAAADDTDAWSQVDLYHDRLRAAVVGTLAESVRRDRQIQLAGALEQTGEDPELCGYAWHAAGHPERAAPHFAAAGHRAADALAFERAADLYARALSAGLTGAEALVAEERLGDVLAATGETAAAVEHYAQVAERAEPRDRVRILWKRAPLEHARGRADVAGRLLDQSLGEARTLGLRVEQGRAIEAIARIALLRADYVRVDELAADLLALADEAGAGDLAAQARILAAHVCVYRGKPGEARAWLEAVDLERCSEVVQGQFLSVMGRVLIHLDEYAAAADHLERGLALLLRRGLARRASSAATNLGCVHYLRGDWSDAEAQWRRCVAWCEQYDSVLEKATLLSNLAYLLLRRGDPAAVRLLEQAMDLATATGLRHLQGRVIGNRAEMAIDNGRLDEAGALLGECATIFAELRAGTDELETARRRGELALARGEVEAALAMLEAAAVDEVNVETLALDRARAEALRRLGRLSEARALVDAACVRAASLDAGYERARLLLESAELSLAEGRRPGEAASAALALFERMGCRELAGRARLLAVG